MSDDHQVAPLRVGVIGLGVMGGAIAQRLLTAGFDVVGYDPHPDRARTLDEAGGRAADGPAGAVAGCRIVLVSVPADSALAATVEAVSPALERGAIVVDTSTLSITAKVAARDDLAARGVDFVDAPVSGTGRQAIDGDLVMMASGRRGAIETCHEVFAAFTREVHDVGAVPNGSLHKFVANLLVTVHTAAAAEGHALAAACGLDADQVQQIMSAGVGSSRMWEIRGPMMATSTYEPPAARLDLLVKDIALIHGQATAHGVVTPLLDATRSVFEAASEAGWGGHDAAVVRRVYDGEPNVTPPARPI